MSRQVVHVTGTPQRLGREGLQLEGMKQPTQEHLRHEMLVEELASAHKMLELGLPARLRPATIEQLSDIIAQIKANPDMGKSILQDVNRTVGMIKKDENGEKIKLIEKPSEKRQQAWASQFPLDKVPERFAQVTMLKDDDGKWTLVAKPENDRTVAVHPSKEDISMYFDMMKNDHDEAHINDFRTQFAQKYYSVVATHPEKEVNLFRSGAPQESLDMINKVNAFKTKDSKILLVATIGDEKQKPVEINQSQWQRLWLADDKKEYKTHLAAILYADVLAAKRGDVKQNTAETENNKRDMNETIVVPPILRQYNDLKKKHPDAMLLFRCGDFYETYKDDAVKASNILGITLTRYSQRKEEDGSALRMAGFPYHALDTFLPKLIRAGERVAICDQIEQNRKPQQSEEAKPEQKQEVKEVISRQEERRHTIHR